MKVHKALLIGILILIIFSVALIQFEHKNKSNCILELTNQSTLYLIYSPSCPHCHALIEYLDTIKTQAFIFKTTQFYYATCLENLGLKWNGGVPLLFGILENNSIIAIQGYPTSSQEVNGYFLGMEKEIEICENANGEKVYSKDGKYLFCRLPNGFILGNKYAVDYLIKTCEESKCKKIL